MLLLAAASCSLSAIALADNVDATLKKITAARASIKTLKAPFDQIRAVGLLATTIESKGELTLVTPDRLRWDVLSPDEVTFWIGPKGLVMKSDEGVSRISKSSAKRFAAVLGDLLILIGGDIRKLRQRYDITVDGSTLTLVPKDKKIAKYINRLVLNIDAASLVSRVTIEEKNGDSSVITFGAYTKNAKVSDDVIDPPA